MGPKKFKGGKRQRIEQMEKEYGYEKKTLHSRLALHLLTMFAWGVMSPQTVQQLAALAMADINMVKKDDEDFEDLTKLASVGSHGVHKNNCHRDILQYASSFVKLQNPFYETIPFKDKFGDQLQAIMLPHETFAYMHDNCPDAFKALICPGPDILEDFWTSVDGHPQLVEHPVRDRDGYKRQAIPIQFHGDGVPTTGRGKIWVRMLTMFSWASMVGSGKTTDAQLYIYGLQDRLTAKGATLKTFFQILAWSFKFLFLGTWPTHPWNSDTPGPYSYTSTYLCSILLFRSLFTLFYFCFTFALFFVLLLRFDFASTGIQPILLKEEKQGKV